MPSVEGVPTHHSLSKISPNNPVLLGHASGELSGLLRETAQRLVEQVIANEENKLSPEARRAQLLARVQLAGEAALRYGVTSFQDAGADFDTLDFFGEVAANKGLPVRLYVMARDSNTNLAAHLDDHYRPLVDNEFLTVRSIKRQIDGALGSHGAWLLEPYEDLTGTSGLVLETIAEIEETARLAIAAGYQVNTHAIGTRANREVLDLYERVWSSSEVAGQALRWRIEHAQHIHADDIPRFAQLGVIASIQGVHATSDGPWIASRLGEERTEQTSYRWRDLLDSGAMVNNGTDVPVESIDPFTLIYAS
ncbi:MAG: putative amidohydrolase YtcJ, partial [Limisphaerales bacterium]